MKKHFITGFLSGALIFGVVGVLAATYTATDNPFPVKLNGNDVQIEGYNIEGSTYFKLRDIADTVGGFEVGFQDNTIQLSKDGYQYSNISSIDVSGHIWEGGVDASSHYSLDFREDGTVYKTNYHAIRTGTYSISDNRITVHLTQFGDNVIDETYEYIFDINLKQMTCSSDGSVLKEAKINDFEQSTINNIKDDKLKTEYVEKQVINGFLDDMTNSIIIREDDYISQEKLKEQNVLFRGGDSYVSPETYGALGFYKYSPLSGTVGKIIYATPNYNNSLFAKDDVVEVDGITMKYKSGTLYFKKSDLQDKRII